MDATISTTTRDLARKYLLEQFATVWEVDAQLLSEWLAENDSHYANLSDEEEVDTALEEFMYELDSLVRQAMDDFKLAEELESDPMLVQTDRNTAAKA